jgi:hypothetical protein
VLGLGLLLSERQGSLQEIVKGEGNVNQQILLWVVTSP